MAKEVRSSGVHWATIEPVAGSRLCVFVNDLKRDHICALQTTLNRRSCKHKWLRSIGRKCYKGFCCRINKRMHLGTLI